jgi:mRNA interferase RelE/StbE
MKVDFDQNFYKRLAKINEKPVLEKVKKAILQVEAADGIAQIPNIKKMEGFKTYYRIRIGDYRIGLELRQRVFGSLRLHTEDFLSSHLSKRHYNKNCVNIENRSS